MILQAPILAVASVVDLLVAFVIFLHAGKALLAIASGKGVDSGRLILAEGVLAALGFSLAATLLKVIGLQDWIQIRTFATVFVLRTLLKQVFLHERTGIAARIK